MLPENLMCDCCGSEDVELLFSVRDTHRPLVDNAPKTTEGQWFSCRKCDRRWFREETYAEQRARLGGGTAAATAAD
jgi:hypothetical protein